MQTVTQKGNSFSLKICVKEILETNTLKQQKSVSGIANGGVYLFLLEKLTVYTCYGSKYSFLEANALCEYLLR